MRIIAGTAGGRRLKAPRGSATRPTADRVREAVFNVLAARAGGVAPGRVLDLYAGSGAMALESLSRGAGAAVCVESHAPTCELIDENAQALGYGAACTATCARVLDWLAKAPGDFDWIFLDPPYAAAAELERALARIGERRLLTEAGVAVAEHEWQRAPGDHHGPLALWQRKRYGQTAVSFYVRES